MGVEAIVVDAISLVAWPSLWLRVVGLEAVHAYAYAEMLADEVIDAHLDVDGESARLAGVHVILAVCIAETCADVPYEAFARLVRYLVIGSDEVVGHLEGFVLLGT